MGLQLYMLKGKHGVLQCFQDFHKLAANQFNARIKIIRTDNGKEYVNGEFGAYISFKSWDYTSNYLS
jgi:hypothetical protein